MTVKTYDELRNICERTSQISEKVVDDYLINYADTHPRLWFNLIGFNGYCWQSYGPVVYYKSFEPDDIWFFATELNPDMEEPGELPAVMERDPLPYMLLLLGVAYPLTFHKEDQILYLLAEHPHYAQAYFDEHKGLLLFSAMTDRGFDALVKAFNAYGHDFPAEPYLKVNMTMVTTANEILKRKVLLNEYHDLFQVEGPLPDR